MVKEANQTAAEAPKYCKLCAREFSRSGLYNIHIARCFQSWLDQNLNLTEIIAVSIENYIAKHLAEAPGGKVEAKKILPFSAAVVKIIKKINDADFGVHVCQIIVAELAARLEHCVSKIYDVNDDFLTLYDYVEQIFLL